MKPGPFAFALLAGILFALHGPDLPAQQKGAVPAKESKVDKERRKGLSLTNNASEPWMVGVDAAADMNGEIEILELNQAQTAFSAKGKLKKGQELSIPVDGEVVLSPIPPKKWLGLAKTGVDFSAKLYLKDSRRGKLFFTLVRASNGSTDNKTCYYSFPGDFEAFRYEAVLSLTPGEAAFADKYVSPMHIIGGRLPPPKAKSGQTAP